MLLRHFSFILLAATWVLPGASVIAESFPAANEVRFLSGTGSDDTTDWEFFVTGGRKSGEWTTIPVPSNWELQGFGSYNYGHDRPKADEQGKYRHTFSVPPEWHDRRIRIVFDGVMTDTAVFINGKAAGPLHQGGFYRFHYDITELVDLAAPNLLEVHVSKISANESVERAERLADFWVFGGIFRPVFLEARPEEHIDWVAVNAEGDGEFRVDVHLARIRKANTVVVQLHDGEGKPVGAAFRAAVSPGQAKVSLRSRVSGIAAWTAETPHLYHASVRLLENKTTRHMVTERFGFRTIEVREGDGVYVNGEKIRFKGVNRHSFWPDTGRTLNRQISYDDARLIKEMNMNAVRMSHYPPDKHFLEACDELGLYVINELTGWHDAYDTAVGTRLVEQMIRRDVNHPSILFWANGNEGGHNFALVEEYAKHDPQNRLVIHPTPSWVSPSLFNGIDTAHYPRFDDHLARLRGKNIYMPTEFLHGLYEGGAGAGLQDYWTAIKNSPVGAGGFIWALTDEGVVRTDRHAAIDNDGNHAPDGIVGPYREKDGSFHTIKELWAPVQITLPALDSSFDGRIAVVNDYAFTNLNRCRFEWRWADLADPADVPAGYVIRSQGSMTGPDVAPGRKGEIRMDLLDDWRQRDILQLTAYDPTGAEIFTWSRPVQNSAEYRKSLFTRGSGLIAVGEDDGVLTLSAGPITTRFDLSSGRLLEALNRGRRFSFGDGPRFVPSRITTKYFEIVSARAGSEQPPNRAAHAIDNDPVSRWSAQGKDAWIVLDLGEPKEFSEVLVKWQNGGERRFRFNLETSPDQRDWTTVFAGQSVGERTAPEAYAVGEVTARFLRLTGDGNSENEWTSIQEIQIVDTLNQDPEVTHGREGDHYFIESRQNGADFRWTVYPSGWVKLDYGMTLRGSFDFVGITFDYPEEQVLAKDWIGDGPHRVWRNRMAGTRFGRFTGLYNDPVPGQTRAVTDFKGYFSNIHRLSLKTREGTMTVLTDTPDLFVRLYTPNFGRNPMKAVAAMPEGDLSFLHSISGIGTKFNDVYQLGQESDENGGEAAKRGTLYYFFAEP